MELQKFIYVVIVTMVAGRRMMSKEDIRYLTQEHERILSKDSKEVPIMCARLAEEPHFGVEKVLGHTWRIYYTWNMNLQKQCLEMKFRNATRSIVNRMHHDMSEYLKTEPNWDAASLLLTMGKSKHEMLLFADQGSPGMFQGVPNLNVAGNLPPVEASVPLLNFHLKLIYGGKYLLMADCQIDVTTLSAPKKNIPYRSDIEGIASNLDLGPGLQACISDRKEDNE